MDGQPETVAYQNEFLEAMIVFCRIKSLFLPSLFSGKF